MSRETNSQPEEGRLQAYLLTIRGQEFFEVHLKMKAFLDVLAEPEIGSLVQFLSTKYFRKFHFIAMV